MRGRGGSQVRMGLPTTWLSLCSPILMGFRSMVHRDVSAMSSDFQYPKQGWKGNLTTQASLGRLKNFDLENI